MIDNISEQRRGLTTTSQAPSNSSLGDSDQLLKTCAIHIAAYAAAGPRGLSPTPPHSETACAENKPPTSNRVSTPENMFFHKAVLSN